MVTVITIERILHRQKCFGDTLFVDSSARPDLKVERAEALFRQQLSSCE